MIQASVILPVYNGEAFLDQAIKSVLNQDFKNFELVIVNDCSTDKSLEIAENYAISDKRIKIINNRRNSKLPKTLNVGHNASSGEYVTWISDDNILKNNFLQVLVNEIKGSNTDIVYSNYDLINKEGDYIKKVKPGNERDLIFGNTIGASFLYKRKVYEEIEGYKEDLYLLEDQDFWLRASRKFTFSYIDRNLYQYRIHEDSLTHQLTSNFDDRMSFAHKLKKMLLAFSEEKLINEKTINFLIDIRLNRPLSIAEFLKNGEHIISDLKILVEPKFLNKNNIYKALRRSFKNNQSDHNLTNLILIGFKFPKILFDRSFSKIETLKLIKSSFRRYK